MFKTLCNYRSKENNRTRYNAIRNKTKKAMARVMRMKAEKGIEAFPKVLIKIFKFFKMMKKKRKDVEGGKCIREIDGRLEVIDIDKKGI